MKCIEDEIPFEVPDGWAWSRIRTIASVKGGKRLPKGMSFSDTTTEHAYIRVTDMKNRSINTNGLKYISDDVFAAIKSYTISKNDLYVTIAGTIGVVGEVPTELDGMNLTENAVKVCDISINKTYLCYVMLSAFVQEQFQDKTHQVAMPKLALERILSTLIPIAPINEQKKIAHIIENDMALVDIIDINKEELATGILNTKSKILDLAIRGKLVPQDPNDEPASVLLERIREEKEKLIKQGKIKRDKNESIIFRGDDNSYYETIDGKKECVDDDIPFEIPDNWEWARLSSIVQVLNGDRGQNYPAKNKLQDTGIPFVSASNIDSGKVVSNNLLCMTEEQYNALGAGKLTTGDIVYCIRGSLGKCGFFTMKKGAIASSLVIVRPIINDTVISEYIFNFLYFGLSKKEISKYDNGSAQPNLAAKDFMKFLVPVPPLSEQALISNKLQEIYSYTIQIEKEIL